MLTKLAENVRNAYQGLNAVDRLARFESWFERHRESEPSADEYDHAETVNDYYSLCSELMQFGWNESLQFAPLKPNETLEQSILRHQRLMIEKLKLRPGLRVIDVGCGVGGPMRRVAQESGATVLCLNNNLQQLERAKRLNEEAGLDHLAEYMELQLHGHERHSTRLVRRGLRDRVDLSCAGQGGGLRANFSRAQTRRPILGTGDVPDRKIRLQ